MLALLTAGDVLVADRGFCSFAHLALLIGRGIHAVFRLHQKQIVDFTPGRAHARPGQKRAPKGMPRSRWIRACGLRDQVVEYFKPAGAPTWMSEAEYRALPESIVVRELRYRIEVPGFRTREVTLVTTLLDAEVYPADELAELYGTRWRVEENLKSLKQTMKMDVLKCKTVDGVLKELTMYAMAYNLVRVAMCEAAGRQGVVGGSGQLHRCVAVAARGRGRGGDAGVGGQSAASGAVRAAGEEAASEAVRPDDECRGPNCASGCGRRTWRHKQIGIRVGGARRSEGRWGGGWGAIICE